MEFADGGDVQSKIN